MSNLLETLTVDELLVALKIYEDMKETYKDSKTTVEFYEMKIKEIKLQLKNKESLEYAMMEKLGKGR